MIRSKLARDKAKGILKMFRINNVPVDVEKIANMLGFKVIRHEFPDSISGVIRTIDNVKVIGINSKHSETRQRFSIAHELGHYVSGHEHLAENNSTFVDDKDKKYLDPAYRQEVEADEFAAELLMPATILKDDVLIYKLDAKSLAKKYNVSEQAMWVQLINLKLADVQSSL